MRATRRDVVRNRARVLALVEAYSRDGKAYPLKTLSIDARMDRKRVRGHLHALELEGAISCKMQGTWLIAIPIARLSSVIHSLS